MRVHELIQVLQEHCAPMAELKVIDSFGAPNERQTQDLHVSIESDEIVLFEPKRMEDVETA